MESLNFCLVVENECRELTADDAPDNGGLVCKAFPLVNIYFLKA